MRARSGSLVFAGFLLCAPFGADANDWFSADSVDLTAYHLFDMGVAKIDSDEYLDLYTSNHSDNQGIFFGGADARFSANRITQIGLNQDLDFPGLEGRRAVPEQVQDGFYVYWLYGHIYFVSNSTEPFRGYFEFPSSVDDLSTTGAAQAVVDSTGADGGFPQTRIDFTFDSPGEIKLQPRHVGVPFEISLDQDVSLEDVFVGWRRIHPNDHKFEASLLDRHGYAWADLDGNGKLDVFVARGGLHGDIGSFPSTIINDELLLQFDGGFVDTVDPSGIYKLAGRGRQVAWVDVNADGMLDLHVGNLRSPNLLFMQQPGGGFQDVAESYGLNHSDSGAFVWLDADLDGDMDLLIKNVGGREIEYHENLSGEGFSKKTLIPNVGSSLVQWSLADMDRDGDLDVFMVSTQGNKVLLNDDGRLQVVDPADFNLPGSGVSAQFVDFDNDSRVDLHLVPGGLYKQRPTGMFYRTGHLRNIFPRNTNRVWGLWFDADIDGNVDLMAAHRLAVREGSDANRYNAKFYRNTGASNNWLQVDLEGPDGNASAIGARVELLQGRPDRKLVQYVGSSEGSRYSQGHYRLYFGLNKMRRVKGLKIHWPNGEVQIHPSMEVNQLVKVKYDPQLIE